MTEYQETHKYSYSSWWWTWRGLKHVEVINKIDEMYSEYCAPRWFHLKDYVITICISVFGIRWQILHETWYERHLIGICLLHVYTFNHVSARVLFSAYPLDQVSLNKFQFYVNILFKALSTCLHTVRLFTESDDTRDCSNTICPPEDEQGAARNMLRVVM